jgi:predicted lipoprotein with Yx(FWY)xxD motif
MRLKGAAFSVPLLLAAGVAASFALAASDRGTGAVVVKSVTNAKLGKKVLATASGLTLYRNTQEKSGHIKCTGGCAAVWPPLTLPAGATRATAGAGVTQASLGKVKRPDGRWQVTFKGQPLYRYSADRRAGQANGQGIGGIWFAVGTSATVSGSTTTSATVSGGTTTTSTATTTEATGSTPYPTYP